MAYYLQTYGGPSNVDLQAPITGLSGDFEIRFTVELVDNEGIVFGGGSSALLFFRSSSRLEVRRSGTTTFNLPANPVGTVRDYSIIGSALDDNVKFYQDGVEFGELAGAFFYDITNLAGPFQTATRDFNFYKGEIYKSGILTNSYFKELLTGSNDRVFPDIEGGNDAILSAGYPADNSQWIFYDDGGGAESFNFTGTIAVDVFLNASATKTGVVDSVSTVLTSTNAEVSKTSLLSGNAIVEFSNQGSLSKHAGFSGASHVEITSFAQFTSDEQATFFFSGGVTLQVNSVGRHVKISSLSGESQVDSASVGVFTKYGVFIGNVESDVYASGAYSKTTQLSGDSAIDVFVFGSFINGNSEFFLFAGGITIPATSEGSFSKIGLLSGATENSTSTTGNYTKVGLLNGIAAINLTTEGLLSKVAQIAGRATTTILTTASLLKTSFIQGVSFVFAKAYGRSFNSETNIETYELTVQGRVKAPLEVQGTVKSLTIQGRIK